MVAAVKHNVFVQNLARAEYNFHVDTLKIALTNSDPAANDTYGAITEITAHNGYSAGGAACTAVDATQTSGTLTVAATGPTITASGGTIGPFRYAYMYDSTDASKGVVLHWDYGSSITLQDGDSVVLSLAGNAAFTLV